MADQFVVPQFIDAEDKIIGPITARQFIELLAAFLIDAILYKLLSFVVFLLVGVPIVAITGIIAFMKINGQPFHFFILNALQTMRRPHLRVWDKGLPDQVLRQYLTQVTPPPPPPPPRKAPLTTSKLQELTLVVNTGGVYKPEE